MSSDADDDGGGREALARERRQSRRARRRRPAVPRSGREVAYSLPHPQLRMPGESVASLIVRNAETYGFRDPARVLGRIRMPGQTLQTIVSEPPEPEFRGALATLLGLEQELLDRISYPTRDPTRFRFNGHLLPREFFLLSRRRYCPDCLRENAFHRMAWDLSLVTGCPRHAVRLIDGCPACHKSLRWQARSLTRCPRPVCWADLRAAAAEPVNSDRMAGVTATLDALADIPPLGAGPPGLSGGELVRLAFQLGAFSRGSERVGRPIDLLDRHPEAMHLILNEGWAALADWPRGFHALLEQLRGRSAGRRGRYGLRVHPRSYGFLT